MTAMSRGSPSSAGAAAATILYDGTPGLRWPASSVTASVSGHVLFSELRSHYLFEDALWPPFGKGNDKGKVEGIVGSLPPELPGADAKVPELR